MDINEFKLKVETILNKHFILKDLGNGNYKLIEDKEKDPIELYVGNAFGELSVKINEDFVIPIDKFINEISPLKNSNVINERSKDIYVDYLGYDKKLKGSWDDIKELVSKEKYLDILINDKDENIRALVAEQGYGLDKLINDKEPEVRAAVAEQGYGLNILINDENGKVRTEVAERGYGLDKLINDKFKYTRIAVAERGYGLDKLINDEEIEVRIQVEIWLKKHNLTIEEYIKNKNYWYQKAMKN